MKVHNLGKGGENKTLIYYMGNILYIFSSLISDNYDPMDCGSIRDMFPALSSGKYIVSLRGLGHVTVFCDMETDGGGWTVGGTFYKTRQC